MPACWPPFLAGPPLATLATFYAPVQPYNLLHTLRSIALKFKWHALAKHFNQRSRHAPSGQGGGWKRGRDEPWVNMPLGSNEKEVFRFHSNTWNSFGQLHSQQQQQHLRLCVCVWAVRVGVAFVTSRMHSNSLEKHKSIRAQPCRTVPK